MKSLLKKIPQINKDTLQTSLVNLLIKFPKRSEMKSLEISPILLKSRRFLQFVYLDQRKATTKNYSGIDALKILDGLGDVSSISMKLLDADIVMKNGIVKSTPAVNVVASLEHDKKKDLIVSENEEFLEDLGIAKGGKVIPTKRAKFTQINEFLKLFDQTGFLEKQTRVDIVDFACGMSYLTIALWHFLKKKNIEANLVGVDLNKEVIEKSRAITQKYDKIHFQHSKIMEYQRKVGPEVVIALHACDTATDQAIVRGIQWRSKVIMLAPCCHHDLKIGVSSPFKKHGIIQQRMQDLITDTMRALLLRICGYKADIIEFVSPEHTNKNIMIRAVWDGGFSQSVLDEYISMKNTWKVVPRLETLILQGTFTNELIEKLRESTETDQIPQETKPTLKRKK